MSFKQTLVLELLSVDGLSSLTAEELDQITCSSLQTGCWINSHVDIILLCYIVLYQRSPTQAPSHTTQ